MQKGRWMGYDYDTCSKNMKSYHLGDVFIETSKRLVSGICKKKKKRAKHPTARIQTQHKGALCRGRDYQ